MNWLILPPDKVADLETLNASQNDRSVSPVTTADGVQILGADLLGDPFWADYQTFLSTLALFEGEPTFPTSSE